MALALGIKPGIQLVSCPRRPVWPRGVFCVVKKAPDGPTPFLLRLSTPAVGRWASQRVSVRWDPLLAYQASHSMVGWLTTPLKKSRYKFIPPGRADLTCRVESTSDFAFSIGESSGVGKGKRLPPAGPAEDTNRLRFPSSLLNALSNRTFPWRWVCDDSERLFLTVVCLNINQKVSNWWA